MIDCRAAAREPEPDPRDARLKDISAFFDVSIDMLCVRDLAGGFSRVSRAWETVLGYPVEQLEGMALISLVHPDDVEATRAHMARVNAGGEVHGFVNRYRHADGSYRPFEWRARRAGDLVFGVARDVTERQALEAQMVAAREAAEAASRAKSDFLANMSHEIRTPLNGVIGIVDALARTELSPVQRELVGLIEGSGLTLERLVSDLLDVSKIEAGQLDIEARPFALGALLDAVAETAKVQAQARGLAFRERRGAGTEGSFTGDATRLRQVLANLLSNAVKFTEAGEVALSVEAGPHGLTFEVADTGVGFDAEQAGRLFRRFSQADASITRRFGGTGLGLSICRSLAELMGGSIEARSEPGRGSVFTVRLPLARADAPAAAPAAEAAPAAGRSLRVLLAEDHPVNQRVVQLMLGAHGAEVTTVGEGAAAVAAFREAAFDVVLMDMQMPVMDGLAATRALRAHEAATGAARTPVIMLSANAMAQHREQAREAGADLHLAKPITAPALMAGVAAVVG